MPRDRGERVKVYVETRGFKYGFSTNPQGHTTHKTLMGQTTYVGAAGVVFGCNSPKPARAVFDGANPFSSFCSDNKISTLRKTENYSVVSKGNVRGVKTSGKTRTVYIDMPGGWKYAWNITAAEVSLAEDLGFVVATGAIANSLLWGVDSPKPPRARKKEATGSSSSFIKPQKSVMDAAVAAGYTVSGIDYDLIPPDN